MREQVLAVARMQDYIQQHLAEPIGLRQLADAAGYSPYHSARMFKELTGKSPLRYLRDMRLSEAAFRLRDGNERVLDVALDYLFESHEGFTRAFTKAFGVAPARYSRTAPPIQLFLPYSVISRALSLTIKEDTTMEKAFRPVFVQIIERPARKALIRRGVKAEEYYAYCDEVGCDIWPLLTSVKEALYEPIGMWLPKKLIAPGTSRYVQGVEVPVDYSNEVPEGYELIPLEPCQMMVFQGPPYPEEDFMQEITAVSGYVNEFDPSLYGYAWADEAAPRFQLAPDGERGYIEARPVQALALEKK